MRWAKLPDPLDTRGHKLWQQHRGHFLGNQKVPPLGVVLLSLLCLGACPACADQGELCRAHTIFTSCIGYNKHVYAEETYFDYFSFNLWPMSEAWEQEDQKIKIEYSGIISRWNEESVNYQLRPVP